MNTIDILLISSLILLLLVIFAIFISGKNTDKKKFLKFIPLIAVILLIASVFYINSYYQKELENQEINFEKKSQTITNDSLKYPKPFDPNIEIDSLENRNKELEQILETVDKGERITGHKTEVRQKIENKIESNKDSIQKVRRMISVGDSIQ